MAKDPTGSPLQPSLLDRLLVTGPKDRPISGLRKSLSARKLRDSVLRDLTWLLNTTNLATRVDFDRFPGVATSIVNYGMPALTGNLRAALERDQVATRIADCIKTFEPRLSQVKVTPETTTSTPEMFTVAFRIEAELWGDPVPQHLTLRTEIDVGSGECLLEDRGA